MKKDGLYLFNRHTTPNDTINTNFEEVGLLPEIVLGISFELLALLVCHVFWYHARAVEVRKVGILRQLSINGEKLLARHGVINRNVVLLLSVPMEPRQVVCD